MYHFSMSFDSAPQEKIQEIIDPTVGAESMEFSDDTVPNELRRHYSETAEAGMDADDTMLIHAFLKEKGVDLNGAEIEQM